MLISSLKIKNYRGLDINIEKDIIMNGYKNCKIMKCWNL